LRSLFATTYFWYSVKPGEHKFWSTQPVPQSGEIIEEDGPIEADKKSEEIRTAPYPLQPDFEWFLVDINDVENVRC
jgi:glycylpeptide N-tetradecanoyltransferase